MEVGYLPDMFGHCSQMPQILHHVGIDRAVVYRGVPTALDRNEFWWRSPDGTGVRTEYLANSYGNAADVFGHGGDARARLAIRLGEQDHWYGERDFLALYGTDHAAPLPTLMTDVADLNADGGVRVRVGTLTAYLEATGAPQADLPVIEGELRSHARANILPGVLSVRWQLKEAMARSERLLARYAEPFAALWLATPPAHYLDLAWRNVIDSSCHDSVTGCGVDETAVQVLARLQEAEHAARAVRDRALVPAASATPRDALVVANPLPAPRTDLVDVAIPVPEAWGAVGFALPGGAVVPAQELGRPQRELARETVRSPGLTTLMHRVHDKELFGIEVADLVVDVESRTVTFELADRGDPDFDAITAEHRLREAADGCAEDTLWQVITRDEPRRRLAAHIPVPALGWTATRICEIPSGSPGQEGSSILTGDRHLDNGLVAVSVEEGGTLALTVDGTTVGGVGRLVDGGDCGDTYNYGPPREDRLVDRPESVTVSRRSTEGPLVGRLRVERRYELPTASDAEGRSTTTEPTTVVMDVELRAGEPFVRIDLAWENRSSDHRLRLHVPTLVPADHSHAQGQLDVVRRGRTAEAGPVGEHPLATFPAERFVDAGGMGVVLGRSTEYEVVDDAAGGTEVAVTLLRAVGYLSRNVHPHRSEPAGPQLPTPAAQVLGPAQMSLTLVPHRGSWEEAGLGRVAEAVLHPVVVSAGTGDPATVLTDVEGVHIEGAGVDLLALRVREGAADSLEARVVNSSSTQTTARVGSDRRPVLVAAQTSARGEAVAALAVADGRAEVALRPWEIATVRLTLGGS